MRIDLGDVPVTLDPSGVAILPTEGIVILNHVPWDSHQGELFPDYGPRARTSEVIERVVGENSPSLALLLGEPPEEHEGVERFLTNLGVRPVWVGAGYGVTAAECADEYRIADLTIGTRVECEPSIIGGWSPGDMAGACYLRSGERLLLPDLQSLRPELPPWWPVTSTAYRTSRTHLVEMTFEWVRASLR